MNKHLRIIGLSNELPLNGKPLIVPYGSYPHKVGKVMQLINAKSAAMMVAEFQDSALKNGFKGLPIYIGHPDVKSYQDKYQDHRSYGWVVDMLANDADQQLELVVDWNAPGVELLTNEQFAYFSPNWLAVKGKPGEALPFKILSVGLTQNPMIEYLALACEDGSEDEEINPNEGDSMNKLLERLKALLPENVQENINSEDDLASIFQKMIEGLKAIRESEKAKWEASDAAYMALENEDLIAGLTGYLDLLAEQSAAALELANEAVPETVTATLDQLKEELALANENLSKRESRMRGLLLDTALVDGRITPATRSKWDERFDAEGADFVELANELDAIDPVMKTRRSVTASPEGNLALTHGDLREEAVALANEKGLGYESAYATCRKQEKFAHLFTEE